MPDLTILRHEHPDDDLQSAPQLAEAVAERFGAVPQIGDRILDHSSDAPSTEWRVYERGFYPRKGEGAVTITLCPARCDPNYFRRKRKSSAPSSHAL